MEFKIAFEDALQKSVILKIFNSMPIKINISGQFSKGGNGYLRSNLKTFVNISNRVPFFLLTDLDNKNCPIALMESWGYNSPSKNFIFRIAVKEVESWLLADHQGVKSLFGDRISNKLHSNCDSIDNPKEYFLDLAKKAPKEVRNSLIKKEGAVCSQALGYNAMLERFVRDTWCPNRASENSKSLGRTINRLKSFIEESIE